MVKVALLVGAILAAFIAEAVCQRYVLPTYRPPVTRRPIIRRAREAVNEYNPPSTFIDEPSVMPSQEDIDLIDKGRYPRSKDSPSAKSYGGGRSSSSGSRDTGATHPGYNRRNARSIRQPGSSFDPLIPSPFVPRLPIDPYQPSPRIPIYARTVRDIQFPGIKKPSYRDVIIPNWNPNVRTNPWNSLGGKRKSRSLGAPDKEDEIYHDYYDVIGQE